MKAKFLNLINQIDRPGIENLVRFLEESDFFTAPASVRHHGAYSKGLVEHSLTVYSNLLKLAKTFGITYPQETLLICGLLHDVCKVNFYKQGTRNKKNEGTGEWEKVLMYEIYDQLPLGHGEKSVIIIQKYIPLSELEVISIRWHMGGFDMAASSYSGNQCLSTAMNTHPLVALLHMADLAACYIDGK